MTKRNKKRRVLKPVEWVESGELDTDNIKTHRDIVGQCCDLLDGSNSTEIIGPGILFKSDNGKWYTVVVEAMIVRASPEFVRDPLKEREEEKS